MIRPSAPPISASIGKPRASGDDPVEEMAPVLYLE